MPPSVGSMAGGVGWWRDFAVPGSDDLPKCDMSAMK
jgi:hypothetical protein